jgi:hypothetical protein
VVTDRQDRARARARVPGFALVGALLLLVLLGAALGVLAEIMAVRARSVLHEGTALQLAASLDAALAESLAALYLRPSFAGEPAHPFGGGEIESQVLRLDPNRVEVTVRAVLRQHRGAALAVVWVGPGGPRVLAWRRVAP